MDNRVIIAVTNDLTGDQRVHKVALSLTGFGYKPALVGRRLPGSRPLTRPYPCYRFRLLFRKGPLFYAAYNIRLFCYLLFVRGDIFLANDLDTLPAVFLAGRIRRKRVVYDSHEYFTEVPELVGRPAVKRAWERIEGLIFPKLTSVYTVNGSIADIYQAKYGVAVRVVRNLPLANRPEAGEGWLPDGFTDRPVIIYQGALNMGRGLEEMIRAMPLLQGCRLLLAGDGDCRVALEELARREGIADRVCFTGRIPLEKLPWFTSKAALGISLEQDIGLNYRYALPNKIFDYMQAGIPLLASDLPEIRKVVEGEGIGRIISRFDPPSLSRAILDMLEDSDSMQRWREAARKAAEKYTWEGEEQVLRELFPAIMVS